MKNANTLILIILVFTLFSGQTNAQKQVYPSKPQNGQKGMVDTRVDNMGYWRKMAAQGLVPVAPVIKIPEAVYTGSGIQAKSIKGGKEDSPDVPVTNATNVTESENSVFVNPADNDFLLNSNNSTAWPNASNLYGANAFLSEDAGLTWGGSAQGAGGGNSGDPTTAINIDGSRMYVNYISNSYGMGISYSTNNGSSWQTATVTPNPGSMTDKNHMWIDNSIVSPYEGNLYVAWTDFGGSNDSEICLKASSNGGTTWGSLLNVSSAVNAGSHNQGVNIQTGPDGQVYVVWSIYDTWPQDEKALGFAKSTNGGTSFTPATRIINNTRGIRNTEVGKNHRVNSFPSMTVDISGGSYNGTIYVVWCNIGVPGVNTGNSADVYLIKSSDEGATWSVPIRVNQDPAGLGKKHYFPWIVCDPETGILSAVFYDDRNVGSNQCEVYCANSFDGGETWEDFKVSDVAFSPSAMPGLAGGYMGDYLGITARGSKVYPAWTDNRGGLFMTYTSPYVTNNLPKPNSLTVLLDENTGATTLNWLFDGSKPFLYFNVYRGGELLGTTTNLTWPDILPDYGVFQYGVTAMHDEGESVPSSASIQWGNPHIAVTPAAIDETLEPGASTVETILVKNVGELDLAYTVTPLITSKKKGKDYCDASGNCDEYISNVTFGDINNSSSCDNYHDYTNLSTIVSLGQTYPITVTNGNPYSSDQCGIWVDWNHDQDFADAGETITVSGTPGNGPYTANIVPPAGALPGETRMRIRIMWTGSLDPCGTTNYGEVEDYSMYVLGWLMIDNYGGTIPAGDSSEIHVTLDAADLELGVYTANINIGSNDPDMGMVTVPVTLTVGEQVLQAIFESNTTEACTEEIVNYYDLSTGGALSWEWTFEGGSPATSTNQNPLVTYLNPGTFDVTLTVSDGIESNTLVIEDYITISGVPEIPVTPTGENEICTNWSLPTQYTTTEATNAESYVWELLPVEAGTILSNGLTATVTWTLNWEGTATIKVKGYNEICGEGEFSEGFDITCSICTGINEKADLKGIQIFPNPTNGLITVSFDNNFGMTEISVMNMLNKVVYSGKSETMTGQILNIDLSNLVKGVYFIKLKTDRQEETRKIIIQ